MEEIGKGIDIILLCETFMNDKIINRCKIKGYKLQTWENRKVKTKGGVAIYVKKGLKTFSRKDLNIFEEGFFESCFIELDRKNNSKNIIIGEIYRIPGTNEKLFLEKYESLLKTIATEKKETIIGTDQNIDYLKINSYSNSSALFDINLNNNMTPTIIRPTRISDHSATLIDNINISLNLTKSYQSAIIITKLSDHFPCITSITFQRKINKETLEFKYRALNENSVSEIRNALTTNDWHHLQDLDVNSAYNYFENTFYRNHKYSCTRKSKKGKFTKYIKRTADDYRANYINNTIK
jgi:hypothetical protein